MTAQNRQEPLAASGIISHEELFSYFKNSSQPVGTLYVVSTLGGNIKYSSNVDTLSANPLAVSYDLDTGDTRMVESAKERINISYNPENFDFLIRPVERAIASVAKLYLLQQLNTLADVQIQSIIQKNNVLKEDVNSNGIDKALIEIIAYAKPKFSISNIFKPKSAQTPDSIALAIYQTFIDYQERNNGGLYLRIKSKQEADEFISAIRAHHVNAPSLK